MREFCSTDYAMILKWWTEWPYVKDIPCRDLLNRGFIEDDSAAAFWYGKGEPMQLVEWFITNPHAPSEKRNKALDLVIEKVADEARQSGALVLCTTAIDGTLIKRLNRLGFVQDMFKTTQLFRRL